MTIGTSQARLIMPFASRLIRKPATPGSRRVQGEWTKRLEDMGFRNWAGEAEPEERRETFKNQVRWDVAHRNYRMLMPCISMGEEYNEDAQQLAYTIDLYGDGSVVKNGHLSVSRGDYLMFYMRMEPQRRKELLTSRIALANVGMLVPYVTFDQISCDEVRTHVHAVYRILL